MICICHNIYIFRRICIFMKQIMYTWHEFQGDVHKILEHISKERWQIKQIYGIPKGGLPLAVCLANSLGVPLISDLSGVYIDEKRNVLICEDIIDSGKTISKIPHPLEYRIVSIFAKTDKTQIPSFYLRECKDDEWITFCWEPKNKKMVRDNE